MFFSFHPAVFAMRIVVQRVKSASVTTVDDGQMISQIGPGILALVGIHQYDTIEDVQYCARRLLGANYGTILKLILRRGLRRPMVAVVVHGDMESKPRVIKSYASVNLHSMGLCRIRNGNRITSWP